MPQSVYNRQSNGDPTEEAWKCFLSFPIWIQHCDLRNKYINQVFLASAEKDTRKRYSISRFSSPVHRPKGVLLLLLLLLLFYKPVRFLFRNNCFR